MGLEQYVTPNCFVKWGEVLVSKEYPEIASKILLQDHHKERVKFATQSCIDPWRMAHQNSPIIFLSWVRNHELNELIGGANDSDHLHANAWDCAAKDMGATALFCSILEMGLPYRQLILYTKSNFVHWSINVPGRNFKRQILIKEG